MFWEPAFPCLCKVELSCEANSLRRSEIWGTTPALRTCALVVVFGVHLAEDRNKERLKLRSWSNHIMWNVLCMGACDHLSTKKKICASCSDPDVDRIYIVRSETKWEIHIYQPFTSWLLCKATQSDVPVLRKSLVSRNMQSAKVSGEILRDSIHAMYRNGICNYTIFIYIYILYIDKYIYN